MINLENYTFLELEYESEYGSLTRFICSIIAFSVGVLSVILNIFAVLAISRIRGSLPVNIRLVSCLVAFDLLVSIVVIFHVSFTFPYHSAAHILSNTTFKSEIHDHRTLPKFRPCIAIALHVMRFTGYNGTLLSLTALATDLYIAIMYPLNYSSLMRKDRVNFIIGFILVIALLLGSCPLYIPLMNTDYVPTQTNSNYCFRRWQSHIKSSFATFGIVLVSVIVVSVVYSTVFYQIRNFHKNGVRCIHQTNKHFPNNNTIGNTASNKRPVLRESSNGSNFKKNQRGLTTTLVLLLVFLCCFLPSFVTEIHLMIYVSRQLKVYRNDITLTLIFMNLPLICSALDPLLYSYRLKDIQISYLKLFCCYRDETKPNLPPLVAGRARLHPTVPVYQPIYRRSIACTSPNSNMKQSLPWSQRLANATGIYIERIRKISGRGSSAINISHKRTPASAPPFNKPMEYEANNEALLPDEVTSNPCYTVPAEISMASCDFISPPKMVLSTWGYATKSLKQSWFLDDESLNRKSFKHSINLFGRRNKLSSYSSSECGACSAHSGSIDSANTNSTGTAGSCNQNRSQSFDNSKERSLKMKNRIIDLPNKITE